MRYRTFKRIVNCVCMLLFIQIAHAQHTSKPDIYPNVRFMQFHKESFPFHGFQLEDNSWSNLVSRTLIRDMTRTDCRSCLELKIELREEIIADTFSNNLLHASGSYDLKVDKDTAFITAHDSVGVYYACQTLSQLFHEEFISSVTIYDFPTIKYRGVVEGFYGTPWTTADRISQLKFYGTIKANTYIYGPKDDPFHSSPHWRKPYPPDEARDIKQLVDIAQAHFVHFVWAIHPGKDIQWTQEDRMNVLRKFEAMYELGVRAFAVFFDDISGEGTDAHKQAALMNFLTEEFVEAKGDVIPLFLCPTEYTKSWADPGPDGYLSILGRELDPSIQIMWTGDHVVSDITMETLKWVMKRIQRPALVWWNFPVSDYVKDHLLLGPAEGLEKGIDSRLMAGILSNPMEHAEASKPAIFGLANYAWNTKDYRPIHSWKQSIDLRFPHSAKAYKLFAENNCDPGKSWSSYTREESWEISPYLDSLSKAIYTGAEKSAVLDIVENYFENIRDAASIIRQANDKPVLIKELSPWLNSFTRLGERGLFQLHLYEKQKESNNVKWTWIIKHASGYLQNAEKDSIPGTDMVAVTGTKVLSPFLDSLQAENNRNFINRLTGNKEEISKKIARVRADTTGRFNPAEDMNIFTSIEPDSWIELEKSIDIASSLIILTDTASRALRIQWKAEEGKWQSMQNSYSGMFIRVPLPPAVQSVRIKGDSNMHIYEVLWLR